MIIVNRVFSYDSFLKKAIFLHPTQYFSGTLSWVEIFINIISIIPKAFSSNPPE